MRYLLIVFTSIILASCNNGFEQGMALEVYKLKADYTDLVPVQLSEDKSRIIGYPDIIDTTFWPMRLSKGYYLGGTRGINTAYCSITIDEYNTSEIHISVDSLTKLIFDDDPFLEYYQSYDGNGLWRTDDAYDEFRIDTSLINTLILENRLEEYFVKLK